MFAVICKLHQIFTLSPVDVDLVFLLFCFFVPRTVWFNKARKHIQVVIIM